MKKFKEIAGIVILFCWTFAFAQAPQRMSYQAVVRNASGALVPNANVGVRISILQNSTGGTAVYSETHALSTNENGLVTLHIGGGNVQSGNFSTIEWGSGTYFIKTETDPNGGINYSISGTSQLLSVPYALYAENTKSQGKTTIYLTGDITDAEAAAKIAAEAGPNTENISILNTTALTTVNLSGIGVKTLITLKIQENAVLQSVILNDITQVYDTVAVIGNPALATLSFSSYTDIKCLTFDISYNQALAHLEFPNLSNISSTVAIGGNYLPLGMPIINLPALTTITGAVSLSANTINLPALTTAKSLRINGLPTQTINLPSLATGFVTVDYTSVTSLTLPSLTSGTLTITSNSVMGNLAFPSMVSGNFTITENSALTTISLPSLTTVTGGTLKILNNSHLNSISFPSLSNLSNSATAYTSCFLHTNAFPSSMINSILHQLLMVSPAAYYGVDLHNQNPHAPPTGQGIIDKQTLVSQGIYIYTD